MAQMSDILQHKQRKLEAEKEKLCSRLYVLDIELKKLEQAITAVEQLGDSALEVLSVREDSIRANIIGVLHVYSPETLTNAQIRRAVEKIKGRKINANTVAVTLHRLKELGLITLDGRQWGYNNTIEDSATNNNNNDDLLEVAGA